MTPSQPLQKLPADSDVDDAAAIEVVSNNYRMCVSDMAKLKALQGWANQK